MSGTSSAICRAIGRASVLMRRISAWTSGGWPASSSSRCVLRHHLGVLLERLSRPAAARPARARRSTSAMWVKMSESDASMIAPANASPNESPNEPPAELTPAASLTRSSSIGDERVVVELRDEQPEPGAGDRAAARPSPSRSRRAARSGSARRRRRRAAGSPARMILLGLRLPGLACRRAARPRTCSARAARATGPPPCALYSSTICR